MKIAPSILSSDFSNLGAAVREVTAAGADFVHIDVMDGQFVPNITIGPCVVKSIRNCSTIPFDVHLMIDQPHRFIEDFAKAGADIITFHLEASSNVRKTIELIRKFGMKVGISIKPKTSVDKIFEYLHLVDMVLIMTVEPGFGGQSFMYDMMDKVKSCKEKILNQKLSVNLEVDGGINKDTIKYAKEAGANICVAGTSVFGCADIAKAIQNLLVSTKS